MSKGVDPTCFEPAADALQSIPDPLLRLSAIRDARSRLESLEGGAVRDAREAGITWKAIGALYGLSKQGAQQRFGGTAPGDART